jgi:hypothetical protein
MVPVPGAAVILAHHAGWQDGDSKRQRERGSSAWRGNCDGTLYLEAGHHNSDTGEGELILRVLKARDGERPAPLHLIRRRVELCESNGYGEPVTSCVIERDRRSQEDRQAEQARAADAEHDKTDQLVLAAMRDYQAATSINLLRPYVGRSTSAVTSSVARILRAGWATVGRRGQPYTVTPTGLAALNGGPS